MAFCGNYNREYAVCLIFLLPKNTKSAPSDIYRSNRILSVYRLYLSHHKVSVWTIIYPDSCDQMHSPSHRIFHQMLIYYHYYVQCTVNTISQQKSNTTNMQNVIILKYEHKFGTFKYILDLCHPTQRLQVHTFTFHGSIIC